MPDVINLAVVDPRLIYPERPDGAEIADLCGAVLYCGANWLSTDSGKYNHEELTVNSEDGRIATLALSLVTDFGRSIAPLIVSYGVSDDASDSSLSTEWLNVMAGIQREIRRLGAQRSFRVIVISTDLLGPVRVDLPGVVAALEEAGVPLSGDDREIVLSKDHLAGKLRMLNNVAFAAFRNDLGRELTEAGFDIDDNAAFDQFVSHELAEWERRGLRPTVPPSPELVGRAVRSVRDLFGISRSEVGAGQV